MVADSALIATLTALLADTPVATAQWDQLIEWELADGRRARAWGIHSDNVVEQLQTRLTVLRALRPHHPTLPLPPAPIEAYLLMYWQLWLPLALTLSQARDRQQTPLIQGILGGQGTGKTTLTQILRQILATLGYCTLGFSIDDLYRTYAERYQLRQADPRLRWRGPPGTHDVELGLATLDRLRTAPPSEPIEIPRFDKSLHGGEGDRMPPEVVQGVDIVLFEGWFLGVRPVAVEQFDQAPDPIRTEVDRQFAQDMNQQLKAYLPLWDRLDRLMIIYPEDYRVSKQWRQQAEQQMKALGKTGMSDAMVGEFVEYFWQALHPDLFITPLKHDPRHTDLVVEINLDRTPSAIYAPE
jgi:D-glycerate 3-kinase